MVSRRIGEEKTNKKCRDKMREGEALRELFTKLPQNIC